MTGFQNIMEKRASQEAEMQVLVEKFLSSGKQVTFQMINRDERFVKARGPGFGVGG